MKPDWKDAPEWAQWLAQDRCGEWFWYKNKPVLSRCRWQMLKLDWIAFAGLCEIEKEWVETLEQRPPCPSPT